MRKQLFLLMIFILTLFLLPQSSIAKTGYVSDMLLLTFRQGPGNNYMVLKTLKSNTPVTILDEESGFYKVELQTKEIGWVDKKFIIFDLPKTYLIDRLKQEKKSLENKIQTVEENNQTLNEKISAQENEYSQKINSLEMSLKAALSEKETISRSLSVNKKKYDTLIEQSKNIQQIVKENKTLHEENKKISEALKIMTEKNKNLFKTAMIKWSLAGVGVLLLGWLIGRSVSSKKRGSGSLLD